MEHQIERTVEQLRLVAQRILQQLKMRDAVFIKSDELAIDYGISLDTLERFRDFDVAVANDLAIPAVKSDLAAFDFGDHPKPVILILENPARVIEGSVGERGEHWLETLWQSCRPAHAHELLSRKLRKVIEYRRRSTPGILCSHSVRDGPRKR